MDQQQWSLPINPHIPTDWYERAINIIKTTKPRIKDGKYLTQLLWQRKNIDLEKLAGWLSPDSYVPSPTTAFGEEMTFAISRILVAHERGEKVAIWGDFDADGITATAVLREGLYELFVDRLCYHIPSRLRESHGLNIPGIEKLAQEGISLIITCKFPTETGTFRPSAEWQVSAQPSRHCCSPPPPPPLPYSHLQPTWKTSQDLYRSTIGC